MPTPLIYTPLEVFIHFVYLEVGMRTGHCFLLLLWFLIKFGPVSLKYIDILVCLLLDPMISWGFLTVMF
jgi:hypothetical protein